MDAAIAPAQLPPSGIPKPAAISAGTGLRPGGVLGADRLVDLRLASGMAGLTRLELERLSFALLERLSVSEELHSAGILRSMCALLVGLPLLFMVLGVIRWPACR
jgi:hypothetical protein